jgi:hypothetical protein
MFICNITPAAEHYQQTRSTVQVSRADGLNRPAHPWVPVR